MTAETIEEVEHIFSVHRNYIIGSDSKYGIGWVKAEVVNFEIDSDNDDLDIVVRLPWGEEHKYSYGLDNLWDSNLQMWTDAYGYEIEDFRKLEYKEIWMRVRYLEIEDGEIESGSNIKRGTMRHGPHTWKYKKVNWAVGGVVTILLLLALILAI